MYHKVFFRKFSKKNCGNIKNSEFYINLFYKFNKELKISIIISALIFTLIGCSVSPRFRTEPIPIEGKVLSTEIGIASYYGKEFHGKKTASGEIFDMHKFSAAHKDYPLGTIIRVTNLNNGKSLVLKINDRGPFVKGRIIDLSYAAANELDFVLEGTTTVKIEVLKWGQNI